MCDSGRPQPLPILDPISLNNLDIFSRGGLSRKNAGEAARCAHLDRDMQSSAGIKKNPADYCGFLEIKAGCFLVVPLHTRTGQHGRPTAGDAIRCHQLWAHQTSTHCYIVG
jgi:hypothetical protein